MMGRLIATRRAIRAHVDAGFSLAEVLVVMLVMGILGSAVSALFIASIKTTESTSARLNQENSDRTAMDVMSRALRTAVLPSSLASCSPTCGATAAFIQGSAFKVAFYADIDNPNNTVGPSQVTFTVDASGNLMETIQPADAGSASTGYTWTPCTYGTAGCALRKKLLATGVITSGANLFTYYSYGSTTPITGNLTATQLANVDAVDLVLSVHQSTAKSVTPTTYVNRVALPNVDTVVQASASAGG